MPVFSEVTQSLPRDSTAEEKQPPHPRMGRATAVFLGVVLGVLLKTMLDVQDPGGVMQTLKEVQLEEKRILVRREVKPNHAKEKIKLKKHIRKINQHAQKHFANKKDGKEKKSTGRKHKKSEKLMKIKQRASTCSSNSSKTLSWMAMKTASQIRVQVVCRQQTKLLTKITN